MRQLSAYTLLLYLMLPRFLAHLLWRGRKQRGYLRHVRERFGHYAIAADRPVIWLHAVSVGETRAAVPLVAALMRAHPSHQIVITHMTPTGREAGEQLFPGGQVLSVYLPYDYPAAVARFLDHFKPALGLLMETEIWFNLIDACKERGIPLLLVNARLSEKSARSYRYFQQLTRESLAKLAAVAAQSGADAERLARLGARAVSVAGNLKFDITPPAAMLELGRRLRARFGPARPVFLAASTREGEELLLLPALEQAFPANVLTVIVPRHPQRFDDVAQLLEKRAIPFQRRSREDPIRAETRVLLGDSMGEMFAYYSACDVAFIGGSLLPFGGQNLMEACAAGKPVLIGPHSYNFAEATRLAIESGAALRVADAQELARQAKNLLSNSGKMESMGKAGIAFCRQHQGATARLMELIAMHWRPREQRATR